jgi:hypothetical protein
VGTEGVQAPGAELGDPARSAPPTSLREAERGATAQIESGAARQRSGRSVTFDALPLKPAMFAAINEELM